MSRIDEIKKRLYSIEENENYVTAGFIIDDARFLLSRLEIAQESLQQIKYEYEQGQDDKVSYRMYKEAVEALKEMMDSEKS